MPDIRVAIIDRYTTMAHEAGLRQRLDHRAICAPVAKWGRTIDAQTIEQQVRRTIRTTVIGVRIDRSGYVDQFNAAREL